CFFHAEDGIRDPLVTGVQTVLFRSGAGFLFQIESLGDGVDDAIRAAKTALAEAERRWVKAQNNQPLRTSRKTAAVARQTLDLHGQPGCLTADDCDARAAKGGIGGISGSV